MSFPQTPDLSAPDSPLVGWGTPPDYIALEPLNIHSNALAASLVVKSGPGKLYGFSIYSSRASSQFIQVFDATSLPADGAIPAAVFTVGATSNLAANWIPARTFLYGCVVCNSSTAATKTIGSADCFFDVQFI